MSNIMSVELTEWANLASTVKSPVASNLASLLRSMSQLSDSQLLSLELPVVKQKVTVWNSSKHGLTQALELPAGKLVTHDLFETDINRETLKKAILKLALSPPNGSFYELETQAEIISKAFPDTYR